MRLCIAGADENLDYRAHCEWLARAALTANPTLSIDWLGHLDYGGIDELLGSSDVVAVPSMYAEPLGAAALEAMAAGAVVIASRAGGLCTTIVDGVNGLLVAPGDVPAWTAALESVLDDPAWSGRLALRARFARRRHIMRDHIAALDELVRGVHR